jgi:hypothetical protein
MPDAMKSDAPGAMKSDAPSGMKSDAPKGDSPFPMGADDAMKKDAMKK